MMLPFCEACPGVHGLIAGDGTVSAGFIERRAALGAPPFAVKGFARNHDTAAQTFTVGALSVSYSGAVTGDMPAGSWNGVAVEVKGSTCAGTPVCGTLTATQVEPNGPRVASIAKAEFEGFVTALDANGFTLGAQQVVLTPGTRFENGVAGDIVLGAKLEAEGSISGGVLTATKISLRDNVRMEGNVASNDGSTITISGLAGIGVQVGSVTKLDGVGSASAIAVGSHVRLRGRAAAGNGVIATELEVRSADSRIELRGPVSAASDPSLTILGTAIDTSTVSDTDFQDRSGASVGRSAFFAGVVVGQPVKVRGTLQGAAAQWEEAELED